MDRLKQVYAAAQDKELFDWNTGLKTSLENTEAWQKMAKLSAEWTTCACGNQCVIIPRERNGQPEDTTLFRLGTSFYHEVRVVASYVNEPIEIRLAAQRQATMILEHIEQRSAELIATMKYNKSGI